MCNGRSTTLTDLEKLKQEQDRLLVVEHRDNSNSIANECISTWVKKTSQYIVSDQGPCARERTKLL